ncbi:transposase [Hymenobacter aerophilus]|uniref:transposase n=1 Tax=Hymenobacter aerophilus TaxID=119644 RepID=UPI0003A691DF|nr:transposase [Hymenobacter aerophilus]
MKDNPQPSKRRRYDAAFRAEALRLDEQSRSTQAAARALNIDPKRIYWGGPIKTGSTLS